MKIKNFLWCALAALSILSSCSDDDNSIMPVLKSSGLENNQLELKLNESLTLKPILNTDDVDCTWTVNDEIVSNELKYVFEPDEIGTYDIHFNASNSSGQLESLYKIVVIKIREKNEGSDPYLSTLIEYVPAPGQFINENGIGTKDGAEKILGKPNTGMITLGGFGGYVIAGFDHTILNSEGHDLAIYGNAFEGSSEPAIVMVSFDYNANGKADDEWFELAGSEYNAEKTIHNYEITYTNPKGYKDVPWTDNQGNSGVVKINDFHYNHNYYPEFIEDQESITFKGTLIENKTDLNYSHPDYGTIVWNPAREWGYADNYSSEYDDLHANTFDFDWAVNEKGEKVSLTGVDFIKIYTATNADGGWLGEVSTEIMGAADLSMLED